MTLIWSCDESCMIRNGCWVRSMSIKDREEESVECIHVTIRQDCLNIYQSWGESAPVQPSPWGEWGGSDTGVASRCTTARMAYSGHACMSMHEYHQQQGLHDVWPRCSHQCSAHTWILSGFIKTLFIFLINMTREAVTNQSSVNLQSIRNA